jgi:hypothetical protein
MGAGRVHTQLPMLKLALTPEKRREICKASVELMTPDPLTSAALKDKPERLSSVAKWRDT